MKDIADSLYAGIVCYINPEAMEKVEIPPSIIDEMPYDFEEDDDEEKEKNKSDELDDDPFCQDI